IPITPAQPARQLLLQGLMNNRQRLHARRSRHVDCRLYRIYGKPMFRVFCLLFATLLALPAHAEGFISRTLNKPVPGGVAVVQLGSAGRAPSASYQGKPVLVVREEGRDWIAVVGIPLSVKPGQQQLQVKQAGASRSLPFQVGSKHYREQRITL